jgi:hypothetical protein
LSVHKTDERHPSTCSCSTHGHAIWSGKSPSWRRHVSNLGFVRGHVSVTQRPQRPHSQLRHSSTVSGVTPTRSSDTPVNFSFGVLCGPRRYIAAVVVADLRVVASALGLGGGPPRMLVGANFQGCCGQERFVIIFPNNIFSFSDPSQLAHLVVRIDGSDALPLWQTTTAVRAPSSSASELTFIWWGWKGLRDTCELKALLEWDVSTSKPSKHVNPKYHSREKFLRIRGSPRNP